MKSIAEATSCMDRARKQSKNISSDQSKSSSSDENHDSVLLPGLPNHLAHLCLSALHPSQLYAVCRSWRRLIYSPFFPHFFSLYALLLPTNNNRRSDSVEFFSFDPIASAWLRLPSPPSDPPLRLLHRHPSFISRNLPIQSVTISNRLILVAATTHHFRPALSSPLVFDPLSSSNHWFYGPPLPASRRWCATGSVGGSIYVASGVGSHYQPEVARSMEKWDINKDDKEWNWEKMAGLKDGRFSREAVEAIGFRGKLYMVNVKGRAVKQGGVYNVAANQWEEMPEGMLAGWTGPVAATMDGEGEMFMVDEVKGALNKYDPDSDTWKELVASSEHLKGAEQITAGRGRVCAVCANGVRIVVVDVRARPPRTWVVNPPPEMAVVAVHVLPRMSLKSE